MLKKTFAGGLALLAVFVFIKPVLSNDLQTFFSRVEKLSIERNGYRLGAVLNPAQLEKASANPVESTSSDTYKFRDENLFVVAAEKSNRILVIYERFEEATQKKIQDLIGDLYMTFDEPTVLAHDKVVYWAYGKKGKISAREFDEAREKKKKMDILATVKCISDIHIMEPEKEAASGLVYYVISSEPILKYFAKQE